MFGHLIIISGKKSPMFSLVPVLLKNLESTSTAIVAMHEQASENSLGRSTVPDSPVTMQNFTSHSQETENFNAGAFSGANVTIDFYNSK